MLNIASILIQRVLTEHGASLSSRGNVAHVASTHSGSPPIASHVVHPNAPIANTNARGHNQNRATPQRRSTSPQGK